MESQLSSLQPDFDKTKLIKNNQCSVKKYFSKKKIKISVKEKI